jgi:hypothetical protein
MKGYCGVKRIELHYICTYEDSILKPTKNCLKKVGRNEEMKIY